MLVDTVFIKGTTTYVVEPGQVFEFKSINGFVLNSDGFTAPSLSIGGTVKVFDEVGSPYSNVPIYGITFSEGFFAQGTVRIEAGGSVTVSHPNGVGHAYGFNSQSRSSDFYNAGLLDVSASATATGVRTYHDGALNSQFDFENRGTIRVAAPTSVQGVVIANGGNFTNSGIIEVVGGTEGASTCSGVQLTGFGSSFLNTGTIRATGGAANNPSVALTWNSTMEAGQTFRNAGVLQGDYALMQRPWVDIESNQTWEFVNTGSMIGKVSMGQVDERLINSGLISGSVDLGFGNDLFDGRAGMQQGEVTGGRGRDTIQGGSGAETLHGGEDGDSVSGGGGADVIVGGDGQDQLSGGQGADLFIVEGLHGAVTAAQIDRITDWSADDTLRFGASTGFTAAGAIARISAGDLTSAITQAQALIAGGTVSYVTVQVAGDLVVFSATEAVMLVGRSTQNLADAQIVRMAPPPLPTAGGPGADDLSLTNGADTFDGAGGDDHIFGLDGADHLVGGAGDDLVGGGGDADTVDGGAGNDTVLGGAGNDLVTDSAGANYLRGDEGNDSIVGGTGFDDINGNMGNDTCVSGGGDDWVVGGRDNDSLAGSAGQNLVYGNLGNDTCEGGDGADIVRGGQDNDSINGGAGNDYVSGDKGSDTVTGGAGADIFHTFGDAGVDRVTDFSLAEGDRVQLDPGVQYTVSQVGADTVISMAGGGQMILVGVQMSSLAAGWIL